MAETATLQGKVTLDAGGWYRGLRAIKSSMASYGKTMGEAFGKLKTGAMLAGAAALAGLGVAARSAQKYGDEIAKASQATGLGTEELSGLRYAAEASGAAWADLVAGIAKSNKSRPGKSLGQIADELNEIADPAEKARQAMEIFGKDLAGKLLPMLNQGSKGIAALKARAAELGLIVTPDQAAAAERFGDAITDLKLAVFGVVRQFLGFGNVTAIIERVTGSIIAFRKSATFNQLRTSVADTANQFLDMGARILATWESLEGGTRSALLSIGGTLAGFGALWYLGLVQPIVGGIAKAAFATSIGLGAMGASIVAFGAFLLGYQLGKALESSLNLSGILMKWKAFTIGMWDLWKEFGGTIVALAVLTGEQIWAALMGEGFDTSVFELAMAEMEEEFARVGRRVKRQFDLIDSVADEPKKLGEAFADAFSMEGFAKTIAEGMALIGDLIPDDQRKALDDLLAKWNAAKGIKFPPLPVNAAAKGAADDAERERDARKEMRMGEAPFRGTTRILPQLPGATPRMNRFIPQIPRPMSTESPRLIQLAKEQLEAEKAAADWLAKMNQSAIRVGVWQ